MFFFSVQWLAVLAAYSKFNINKCNKFNSAVFEWSQIFQGSVWLLSCKQTSVPLDLQLKANISLYHSQTSCDANKKNIWISTCIFKRPCKQHQLVQLWGDEVLPWTPPAGAVLSAGHCSALPLKWNQPSRILCGSQFLYPDIKYSQSDELRLVTLPRRNECCSVRTFSSLSFEVLRWSKRRKIQMKPVPQNTCLKMKWCFNTYFQGHSKGI